jgi:hypothetical protein
VEWVNTRNGYSNQIMLHRETRKIMSETPTTKIVVVTAAATTIPDKEVAHEDAEAAEETIMIRMIT